jgi:hypothetical protein
MAVELHIRRGTFVNDDPQSRCYNGCCFAYHYEWSEWEKWMEYPDLESAKIAKRIFSREDLEFKIVKTETV